MCQALMRSFTVLALSKRDRDQALVPGRGSLPLKVRQFAAHPVISGNSDIESGLCTSVPAVPKERVLATVGDQSECVPNLLLIEFTEGTGAGHASVHLKCFSRTG
jgi:hypothetical protein